ncbi:hypothetical protein PIB30_068111 [Stylosanthes scabra]|uniref:Uncharacterized protein n=1 Tax=Stylosanthes scabra TaxID=79078 RepID=A0ABU6QN80_9FABA|nr:hypothetical protein [Stylosanthes scabra]
MINVHFHQRFPTNTAGIYKDDLRSSNHPQFSTKTSVVGEPLKTKPAQRVGLSCFLWQFWRDKTWWRKQEISGPVLKGDRRASYGWGRSASTDGGVG